MKERANFGVQQLPLFNLLEPVELDWQVCLSHLEGKRRLDTRVPGNLHSHVEVSVNVMSGMGLQMPFGELMDRSMGL